MKEKLKQINLVALVYYMLMPIALSFIISMLIPDYTDYYNSLQKIVEVPSIVFPIVWTILYLCIGLAAYFVDRKGNKGKALDFYYAQLFFNLSWPIIFFGFKLITLGFIWILIILVLAVITMCKFYKINKVSGYLFIPYILWLIFAMILNLSILILN